MRRIVVPHLHVSLVDLGLNSHLVSLSHFSILDSLMCTSPLFSLTLFHTLRKLVAKPSILLLQNDTAPVAVQAHVALVVRPLLAVEWAVVLAARIVYEVALADAQKRHTHS